MRPHIFGTMTVTPGTPLRCLLLSALVLATGCQGFFALSAREPTPAPETGPAARPTTRTRSPQPAPSASPATATEPAESAERADAPRPEPPDPEPEPAASDSAGVARLVRLAHLWHTVALHHPAVASQGVPWDSALIIATLRVRAANDDDALRSAYRRMLAVLRDPATRVERADRADPAPVAVSTELTADSVAIFRIATTAALNAADSVLVAAALQNLPRRVLIDLRGAAIHDPKAFADRLDVFLARSGLTDALVAGAVPAPVERTRRIGIWSNDEDITSDSMFRDGWQSPAPRLYTGQTASVRAVALLADSGTVLPGVLLALHDAGLASLIADGGLRDAAPVTRATVKLSDGLVAIVRTGELVHRDGSLGVLADTTISRDSTAADDAARAAALTLLSSGKALPLAARPLPIISTAAKTPVFYDTTAYPFMGARLLGGFRLWSAMRTRHAHRDLYDDDLDAVFDRVMPKLEASRSAAEYARAVAELAASLDDPQGMVHGASAGEVTGLAAVPFRVRAAEGRVFVTDVIKDSVTTAIGLVPGTEITAFDGYPVVAWFYEHRRAAPASNEWTRLNAMVQQMSRGRAADVVMKVRDVNNRERTMTVPRTMAYRDGLPTSERPNAAPVRQLADGIGYIDVERIRDSALVASMASALAGRGVILDLRGTLHDTLRGALDGGLDTDGRQLLRRLATRPRTVVGRVVQRIVSAPCAASIREATYACPDVRESRAWERDVDTAVVYGGRVVVLIDERTEGAMERLALSLEQMATVTFIGGASAGSPSWITPLSLPGGLEVGISPRELRRADGGQIQRVGLTPQVEVRPTARGLRAGDDEVLARALQWLQQQLDPPARRRR